MPNKNYSRNAEQELEVVKYSERHGNAADAKHYNTNESNILYWPKQKLVLAKIPAKKTKNQIMFCGITQKTTTIEIAAKDESVSKDIASYSEALPD